MQSIEIAKQLLAPKINNPISVFTDSKLFEDVLFWARESARELFSTQVTKLDLVRKIDDLGMVVDEIMTKTSHKMLDRGKRGKNSLFTRLCSSEKTIEWLIQRWANVFVNIATNKNYKDHIDACALGKYLSDNIGIEQDLDFELMIEDLKKLPKNELKTGLKKFYDEMLFDWDLDLKDFEETCEKYKVTSKEVLGYDPYELPQMKIEPTESGHSQLVLFF
jgi:hypothetical protein